MTTSDPPPETTAQAERFAMETEKRLETRIRVLEEEKAVLAAQLEQRFEELGTLTRIMAQKEDAATTREAKLTQQLVDLRTTLEQMQQSTSWRITSPVRWIMRLLRGA